MSAQKTSLRDHEVAKQSLPNQIAASLVTLTPRNDKSGFTLIELLVVIAIIAILSVVGIVVFTGVQKGARDARRKADIDAIAKAYEAQNSSGRYVGLTSTAFASGAIPKDPTKGDYFNWLDSTRAGFKICASLDNNPNDACNTPALNCFCKFSSQGTVPPGSAADLTYSTNIDGGLGGSVFSPTCDPNGRLTLGLVGYWKMDETSWNGTSGEVNDSSGSNHGTAAGGATTVGLPFAKFGNAGNFNGNGYVSVPSSSVFNATNTDSRTWGVWVKPGTMANDYDTVFTKGSSGANNSYYLRRDGETSQSEFTFYMDYAGDDPSFERVSCTNLGDVWHHIVVVLDRTSNKLLMYLNGALASTEEHDSSASIDNSSQFRIGISANGGNAFAGLIDDVRVYNRALSSEEISILYNNGDGCI